MSPAVTTLDLVAQPGRPIRVNTPAQVDLTGAVSWLAAHRAELDAVLLEHGAVLLRGLPLRSPGALAAMSDVLIGPRLAPVEHDAAQLHHGDGIYSVSDGPAVDATCLHNTQSHATEFPRTLLLACLTAPERGGAVTLGESRRVLDALPSPLRDRFRTAGWVLERTYLDFIGVPWSEALGARDRAAADEYCRRNDIEHTWTTDGGLTTRQRRPAFVTHPLTGEDCWFNTILYFSKWSMEPAIRELLTDTYGDDRLPFDTRFGDGAPLTQNEAMALDAAYRKALLREPWQSGDLLLVDNIRMAHGRDAYHGDREVAVAMGAPITRITPDR